MASEIIVASTTASEAELQHLASENWREPFAEPPAAAPEEKQPEGDDAAAEEAAPEGEASKADPADPAPEKPRGESWRKRVDKLTRTKHSLEDRIAQLEGELRTRQAPAPEAPATPKPTTGEAEPTPEAFDTYEAYIKAQARWEARQEFKAVQDAAAQEAQQARQREVLSEYNRQLEATRAKYADFDDVVEGIANGNVQIPSALTPAIMEADNGPDIAYYLGKHPEEAQKICEMSLARAAVEIGRISARLTPPATTAKPKPAASAAPPPPRPPAARSVSSPVPLAEVTDFKEYLRRRNAGES